MRSSICPLVGLTTTSGSIRPVGRTICSTTWSETVISYAEGVADMKTHWLTRVQQLLVAQGPVVSG